MAADVRRVEPFQREHARPVRALHGVAHAVEPVRALGHEPLAGLRHLGGGRKRAHVGEHLADRRRIEGEHLRLGQDLLRECAHLLVRHRAHLAHLLGHDEVRLELVQQLGVELVDRLAAPGPLAHLAVDLGGREAVGDHAPGHVG